MKTNIAIFCRKCKKLAARTRALYGQHLDLFAEWCAGQGVQVWEGVTVDLVEQYLEEQAATWSPSTCWSAICAIRKFVRWQYGDGHPVCAVTVERPDSAPQRTLNARQADQLLGLFDTSTIKGTRDLAICALMLDTGLRAAELVSVELRHLDLDESVCWAIVKGGEWEAAAFFAYTASCLARWLAARELVAAPEAKTLFVSVGGTKPGQPITRDGLRAIFRRFSLGSELGLISPHDLRRSFATLASEAGAPSRIVQVAGRWKHIKQVERYTRALRAKALKKWSPVNRLMGIGRPIDWEE